MEQNKQKLSAKLRETKSSSKLNLLVDCRQSVKVSIVSNICVTVR